jgi:hypothetical protein
VGMESRTQLGAGAGMGNVANALIGTKKGVAAM